MKRPQHLVFNIALAVNCLLLFLLLFESRVVIPGWLQVFGRLHPVLLHFPVVLVLIGCLFFLFGKKWMDSPGQAEAISDWLLLLAALVSAVTALAGLFLSREAGYDPEALFWHKWSGTGISWLLLGWVAWRKPTRQHRSWSVTVATTAALAIVFTGHQGATITHGRDFLWAPLLGDKDERAPTMDEALVYTHLVRPILAEKCMSCHNRSKAKGQLVMESEEWLIRGGRSGKLWDSTAADLGLMMQRIHLSPEAKKHMPPKGKPQLTDEEVEILAAWLKAGADFKLRIADLPAEHFLHKLAEGRFGTTAGANYEFEPAGAEIIRGLNSNYRVVSPIAAGSPALSAVFYGASQYRPDDLKALEAVKRQLVELNLDKMPLREEDLDIIGQFHELRKLNLSMTGIRGEHLSSLGNLKELQELSISGTTIKVDQLKALAGLKKLQRIMVWNTGLTIASVQSVLGSSVAIETGFRGDTIMLRLTPPVVENEQQVILGPTPLRLRHYIKGVSLRYTLDGSAPDSLRARLYQTGDQISGDAVLKVIAYKTGWYSSDTATAEFFSARYRIDSLVHLQPVDRGYPDENGRTLTDLIKGDRNFRSGKWVAFRNNDMEAVLVLKQPATIRRVSLGCLVDIGSYLMPAESLELWGGDNPAQLRMLARLVPRQPGSSIPAYLTHFDLNCQAATVRYLKVVARPVTKLPAWHPGKGQRGWFFIDEILLN